MISFRGYLPSLERVSNRTREVWAEKIFEGSLQSALDEYPHTSTGAALFITGVILSIASRTAIALEGVPLQQVSVTVRIIVRDECGKILAMRNFSHSWNYPSESSIVRTETQRKRAIEKALQAVAEKAVRWLAKELTLGKIKPASLQEGGCQ